MPHRFDAFHAVLGGLHPGAQGFQQFGRHHPVGGVVFHDEDGQALKRRAVGLRLGLGDQRFGLPGRELQAEDRAYALGAGEGHRPAHHFGKPPRDGQAKPGSPETAL